MVSTSLYVPEGSGASHFWVTGRTATGSGSVAATYFPNVRSAARTYRLAAPTGSVPVTVSKSFVRVLPPKDGNSVVLTTVLVNVPDTANPARTGPPKLRSVSVSITLTYDPTGKALSADVTSSDPRIRKIYQALDLTSLLRQAQDAGSGLLYGQPLVEGQPVTSTLRVPTQGLFLIMFGLAENLRAPNSFQLQSEPLTVHRTTTYTGQDAEGNFNFSQAFSSEPWVSSLSLPDGPSMKMNIGAMTGAGTSVIAQGGIVRSSSTRQNMSMNAQLDLSGEKYRLFTTLTYDVTSETQLKKLVLP